jgi:hypothetical protein
MAQLQFPRRPHDSHLGVADEVKPTDIICPQDYSFFVMRKIQDRKYGVWSAAASMSLFEMITLEGIAVAEFKADEPWSSSFQQSQLTRLETLMRSYNVRLESPLEPGDGEHSDDTLRQSNYGGRLGLQVLGFDLHGMYYFGYDHLPVFELHSSGFDPAKLTTSAGLTDPVLRPEYKRLHMCGFDIQRALPFGIAIRAEAALFNHGKYFMLSGTPRTSPEELAAIAARNAGTMTGVTAVDQGIMTVLSVPLLEDLANNGTGFREKKLVEYTAGFDVLDLFALQGLYLNLQFNQKINLDHDPELADRQFRNMGTAQLKYSLLRDSLALIAESSYGITAHDIYARLAIEYVLSENCRVTAGCTLFEALDDSEESRQGYFGQFDRQDFVAAGITYTL